VHTEAGREVRVCAVSAALLLSLLRLVWVQGWLVVQEVYAMHCLMQHPCPCRALPV
jgi:hypothetical protein